MSNNNNKRGIAFDMADTPPPPPPKTPVSSNPLGRSAESSNSTSTDTTGQYTTITADTARPPGPPPNVQSSPLLSPPLLLVEIEEGTPAAEALRANADIRVSKVLKAARSTKIQAGVRVLKSAARSGCGLPGHAGDRRGAPAFVSPRDLAASGAADGEHGGVAEESLAMNAAGVPPPTIPEVDDEGDSDAGSRKKGVTVSPKTTVPPAAAKHGAEASVGGGRDRGDSISSENPPSLELDAGNSVGGADGAVIAAAAALPTPQQQQPSYMVHSLLLASSTNNNQITHAALPAAVAAACRAGEELERERRRTITAYRPPSASDSHRRVVSHGGEQMKASPSTTPRWSTKNLFKSSKLLSPTASDDNRSKASAPDVIADHQQSDIIVHERLHRRASSGTIEVTPSLTPRPTVIRRHSSLEAPNRMPSEISVAETEKHTNLTNDHHLHDFDDLSDDEILTAEFHDQKKTSVLGNDEDVSVKKTHVDPIVIKLPDQFTEEDSKAQKGQQEEEDDHRQAEMTASKKKKMLSKRFKLSKEDDEAFHFHGPNSVRKWVNRRRTKESGDKRRSYVKGKVIDGKHELYTMSIAVMLGMRTSIGRTNMEMSETAHNKLRWLDNDDLMAVVKYVFPPRGGTITPPHPLSHTFKFKDYSPLGFAYLRRMFGVNEYDFLLSVCGNANYIEFQSNAKSGQFFFYSKDGKYMIKTMTNAESKFLRRILPHYFRHCSLNPNTLVTKFLGMYRVKLYHLRRNVKFVVMKSVYDTDKHLDQLFDVKGSSKGRDAKPGEAVKKDNDVRRALPDGAFVLEPGLRDKLRIQVQKDCDWLKSMKIMDYSMLIGVHNIRSQRRSVMRGKSGKSQTDQDSVISSSSAKSGSQQSLQSFQSIRNVPNDDADEISNSSVDASHATLEHYLDDDDDDSYLKGSTSRKHGKKRDAVPTMEDGNCTLRLVQSVDADDESAAKKDKEKADALVEQAIQDMYWPFHRYYDIQGRRRLNPIRSSLVTDNRKKAPGQNHHQTSLGGAMSLLSSINESNVESVLDNGGRVELPTFEQPLSFRKDGGFMMDLTGMEQPLKLSVPGAPEMVDYCDGKIFYMGIIDILQQFNIRKRVEAKYRRIGTKGWEAASCVHPSLYADRFVRFYDEYTEGINLREDESESPDGNASTSEKDDDNEAKGQESETPNEIKDKAE
jgi:1-phosphatidylinositol-4-phosphate 5-kinase